MIYESKQHSLGITTDKGHIQFTPYRDPVTKDLFGRFDSASSEVLRKLAPMTTAQIDELVQESKSFTDGAVGENGIWFAEDRLSAVDLEATRNAVRLGLSHLDEDTLRTLIAKKGGAAPVKATKDALVELAVKLHVGEATDEATAELAAEPVLNSTADIANLTEAQLREAITANNGEAPVSATKAQLQAVLEDIMTRPGGSAGAP